MKDMTTIIPSKNRPLQLSLALGSLFSRCENFEMPDVNVIYKCDSEYEDAYSNLKEEWAGVNFIKENSFRHDVMNCLEGHPYVFFVVDDCIFTHDFDLRKTTNHLDNHENVFGVSLRLGKNTTYCYTMDRPQQIPNFVANHSGILSYEWMDAQLDFAYPAEVSSSVYRTKDFATVFSAYRFRNPNELESLMFSVTRVFGRTMFLLSCFEQSVAFCNPCNKVQNVALNNRAGIDTYYTPENLLNLYNQGVRINPEMFHGFVSNSTHMEVSLIHD